MIKLPQHKGGRRRMKNFTRKDLLLIALVTMFLSLMPARPAAGHSAASTCSVSKDATTGNKLVFVGHIKDGDTVYLQQNGMSKRIYRGHTYTNRKETASVHSANGWTKICSG